MFSLKKTLFLIFTLILLSSALYSTIINVPGTWLTIQSAIDIAIEADTVLVQPGTYYENINYNGMNITIGSLFLMTQDSAYIASTIIDGSNDGRVVTINSGENDTAVLSGFTITNGYASGTSDRGGGIFIYGSSPTLENLIVTNNEAVFYGGGIYCYESSSSLSNSIISNNITSQGGGGIVIHSYSNMSLYNVTISDNIAYRRGGISCSYSDPILENVTVTGNTVTAEAGGIFFTSSNPILENVTIAGNSAGEVGGGGYFGNIETSLTNCIVWNNSPDEIYCSVTGDPNTITVSYTDIEDGQAGIITNGNCTVNWLGGNINSNPMFVNPNINDYHLQPNSPCIDAGDPSSPLDPDGTIADMGAFYFYQPPVADFTADTTVGIPPFTVNFTDLSTQGIGPIDEWYWDFGDGNNSTLQNPSNEYQDFGGYTVSLTVTNINDFTDTIIKENYIIANPTGYNGPVWHVSTTGSDEYGNGSEGLPFATIQHGFDVSADADTVLVQPGTYVENVEINEKLITVGSLFLTTGDTDYISSTIIDGDSDGNVVYFLNANSSTILCGFTITNGTHGIYCLNNSNLTLKNLIITGNSGAQSGGGIVCSASFPNIEDVTITDNSAEYGGGIYCSNIVSPILKNVTISGNTATITGGGICCMHGANPILINCIIWDNSWEEIGFYGDSDPNSISISYSDVEGGEAGIVTNGNGTVSWLEGNIDMDPMFVDAGIGDYHLLFGSPCIDAGDPNSIYDPDGSIADMGAWFYDHGNAIEDNEIQHVEFNLSNYPNPFNPLTTIEFDIKEFEVGVLSIFNIKGQLIETHKFEAGQHDFQWDASNQASGVYLYKLKTESSTVNKKMFLLK